MDHRRVRARWRRAASGLGVQQGRAATGWLRPGTATVRTALMRASAYGHTETVQALLAAGANTAPQSKTGNTALMLASMNGHTEAVRVLLMKGADVTAAANGGTWYLYRKVQSNQADYRSQP